MKKRYEAVSQNMQNLRETLASEGINAQVHAKQLYHDHEEITVHVRRMWSAVHGCRDEPD